MKITIKDRKQHRIIDEPESIHDLIKEWCDMAPFRGVIEVAVKGRDLDVHITESP